MNCGTLRKSKETAHCFPSDASHHYICCTNIKNLSNPYNRSDKSVAYYNPLENVIKRNSDKSNYSWCTCSEKICTEQLGGKVEWDQRILKNIKKW